MNNPLKVSLENIIPLTFARDHFSQIVSEVQKDKLYVLTKGGKPAVAIIDVKYLESITGGEVQKEDIQEEIKKAPEKVGLAPMVEHKEEIKPTPPPAGFAAPRPPSQASGVAGGPQPKPEPKPAGFAAPRPPAPKPIIPPSPPIPKPEPKPVPPPPPKPPEPLAMPEETKPPTSIPNKPLTTLPPVNEKSPTPPPVTPAPKSQVDIQFAPDEATLEEKAKDGKIPDGKKVAPDDENPPAQYAGEKDNPPAGGEPEPEDMALD